MTFALGYHTETAGTAITELIPPVQGKRPVVTAMHYRTTGTSHTLTFMRPVAKTAAFSTKAGSQNDIELDTIFPGYDSNGDEETLTTSDWLCWLNSRGQYEFGSVSTVNNNTVTMTTALAASIRKGAPVWVFYEVGRASHVEIRLDDTATKAFREIDITTGIDAHADYRNLRTGAGDPIIFHSNNITNAGALDCLCGVYRDAFA